MKKYFLFLSVIVLTACSSKAYQVHLPEGWQITEETETQIVLESAATDEASEGETYTIRHLQKPSDKPFTVWLLENKEELGSSFVDVCSSLLSSGASNAYNCGATVPEYYLVNTEDDTVLVLFPGEEPKITLEKFQSLFTF
jgi:hypothetical protein